MINTENKKKKKYQEKVQSETEKFHESDLTNEEWEEIKEFFPENKGPGAKRTHSLRAVINGIMYLLRTGCQWEYIPKYYPPWSVCRYYFDKWIYDGTLEKINDALRKKVRISDGREPEPTACIIDSQSKKTTEAGGEKGYDGNKKVDGRKRFILVDTCGNLLEVIIVTANTSEQAGGKILLEKALKKLKEIQLVFADGGFNGLKNWLSSSLDVNIKIIKRKEGQKGFVVLPRRWVVECTLAWLCRHRRLMVDYEHNIESSVGMILLASIRRFVRKLAH